MEANVMGFSVKQSEQCPNCGHWNEYMVDVFTIFNPNKGVENVQGMYFCFKCEYECGFGGKIELCGVKNPNPDFYKKWVNPKKDIGNEIGSFFHGSG
jgi:hypothetical protein